MFIHFDTNHERDRQTHRQTPHDGKGRAAKSVHSSRGDICEFMHALEIAKISGLSGCLYFAYSMVSFVRFTQRAPEKR